MCLHFCWYLHLLSPNPYEKLKIIFNLWSWQWLITKKLKSEKKEKKKLSSLLRKQGNVVSLENFFRQLPFRQLMKWHETSFQAPERKIKCLLTFHFIMLFLLCCFFFFPFNCYSVCLLACLFVCLFVCLKCCFIPQTINSFNSSFFCLSISLPTSYSMSMGMCEYQT